MKQKDFQEFVINHLKNQSEDIKSLKGEVSSIKSDISSLNIRVTEQEKFHKFAAKHLMNLSERMFDGHLQHERRLDRIEKKLGLNM